MAGVFDIDIHDPDMGNNVDLDNDESDDDVIEVEVSLAIKKFSKFFSWLSYCSNSMTS